jgi:hypothetical protein
MAYELRSNGDNVNFGQSWYDTETGAPAVYTTPSKSQDSGGTGGWGVGANSSNSPYTQLLSQQQPA